MDESGEITHITIRGSRLYYQPIPGTYDTLTLSYFKLPTSLSFGDQITEIEEAYVVPVLANYVLAEMFREKNADLYASYNAEFIGYLSEMQMFEGPYKGNHDEIPDDWGM